MAVAGHYIDVAAGEQKAFNAAEHQGRIALAEFGHEDPDSEGTLCAQGAS